jgi:hypothetical protein
MSSQLRHHLIPSFSSVLVVNAQNLPTLPEHDSLLCLFVHLILFNTTYLLAKPPFNPLVIKIFHSRSHGKSRSVTVIVALTTFSPLFLARSLVFLAMMADEKGLGKNMLLMCSNDETAINFLQRRRASMLRLHEAHKNRR